MNIIIVGCGKVGYAIASQLTDEGHSVAIIDTNKERLERACSSLDAIGYLGNGTVHQLLLDAGIKEADVFIAVTKQDEVNMLSCVIARKASKCKTIARIKSPEYYEEISFLSETLGISLSFNPESMTAEEADKLVHLPSALEIDTFAKGLVDIVKIKLPKDSILHDCPLKNLGHVIGNNDILVCAVERDKTVTIPDGNFVLKEGDIVSFTMPNLNPKQMNRLFNKIGIHSREIKDVVIAGGGTITYYLAEKLLKSKVAVTIIEPDKKKCMNISTHLPKAKVIHGDYNDNDILLEEGIADADAVIALSDSDEENIVFSLYASRTSSAKVITKINRLDFFQAFEDLPGSLLCPRNITAEAMIGYVRSLKNSYNSSNVEALYKIVNGKVEALEFKIEKNSPVTNTPLMDLTLRSNLLICCIIRKGHVIKPSGKDVILPGDIVVVVTTDKGLESIDDILK